MDAARARPGLARSRPGPDPSGGSTFTGGEAELREGSHSSSGVPHCVVLLGVELADTSHVAFCARVGDRICRSFVCAFPELRAWARAAPSADSPSFSGIRATLAVDLLRTTVRWLGRPARARSQRISRTPGPFVQRALRPRHLGDKQGTPYEPPGAPVVATRGPRYILMDCRCIREQGQNDPMPEGAGVNSAPTHRPDRQAYPSRAEPTPKANRKPTRPDPLRPRPEANCRRS